MFVFGHVGLTWAGTLLVARLSRRLPPWGRQAQRAVSRAATRAKRYSVAAIDYRLLILGAILPDLIDKPLGVFLLREQISDGRFFAHSLLFVSVIGMTSLVWRGEARRFLIPLALGLAAHLVLDRMWMQTDILFWPLRGWLPERQDVSHWPEQMLELLFSDPYNYISEVVGAGIVAALLAWMLKRHSFREFIRTGWMKVGLADGEESPQQLKRGERPAER